MLAFENALSEAERDLRDRVLDGFVPDDVCDFHAHLLAGEHFGDDRPAYLGEYPALGLEQYRSALEALLPGRVKRALLFGMPAASVAWAQANEWLAGQIGGDTGFRGLALCPPEADAEETAAWLDRYNFRGIKPYHIFTRREDTMQASVEDYAPEWMWECLHARRGVLMLHLVRDEAIADEDNIATLRRLSAKYPGCQVVLAHIARSFCRHHAHEGLERVVDCGNIWLDTSAITESETFVSALRVFGAQRILFGTDYPVSHFRGRCVTEGRGFRWDLQEQGQPSTGFFPVGLESLRALRQAMEEIGATASEVEALFSGNAQGLLPES